MDELMYQKLFYRLFCQFVANPTLHSPLDGCHCGGGDCPGLGRGWREGECGAEDGGRRAAGDGTVAGRNGPRPCRGTIQ